MKATRLAFVVLALLPGCSGAHQIMRRTGAIAGQLKAHAPGHTTAATWVGRDAYMSGLSNGKP